MKYGRPRLGQAVQHQVAEELFCCVALGVRVGCHTGSSNKATVDWKMPDVWLVYLSL